MYIDVAYIFFLFFSVCCLLTYNSAKVFRPSSPLKTSSAWFFILLHLVILGPRPSNFPSIPIVFQALYRINPTTSFLLVRVVVFEGSCFIEFSFITVWFRVFSLYTTILYFFNEKQWVARANASRMKILSYFFWIDMNYIWKLTHLRKSSEPACF